MEEFWKGSYVEQIRVRAICQVEELPRQVLSELDLPRAFLRMRTRMKTRFNIPALCGLPRACACRVTILPATHFMHFDRCPSNIELASLTFTIQLNHLKLWLLPLSLLYDLVFDVIV